MTNNQTPPTEHECKVIPVFKKHGDAGSLTHFECPVCNMKYAIQDVNIPDTFCVSFSKTKPI